MINKKRQAVGVDHGNSKLTEADVIAIRSSNLMQTQLAKDYGVSKMTISLIKRGLIWKHLL